jgi:hypothetical protein
LRMQIYTPFLISQTFFILFLSNPVIKQIFDAL